MCLTAKTQSSPTRYGKRNYTITTTGDHSARTTYAMGRINPPAVNHIKPYAVVDTAAHVIVVSSTVINQLGDSDVEDESVMLNGIYSRHIAGKRRRNFPLNIGNID